MKMSELFGKHKFLFGGIILLTIAQATGSSLTTVFLTNITDSLIQINKSAFISWFIFTLILALLSYTAGLIFDYLVAVITQSINQDIRNNLATGLVNFSNDDFHEKGTTGGYLAWFINDIQLIDNNGLKNTFQIISNCAMIVTSLIAIAYYHWLLLLVTLLLGGLILLIPKRLKGSLNNASEKLTRSNELFINTSENMLQGYDTFLSFHHLAEMVKQIGRSAYKLSLSRLKFKQRQIGISILTNLRSVLCTIAIVVTTSVLVYLKQLTPGALITTMGLTGSVFYSLSQLSSELATIKSVRPIFAKYQALDLQSHSQNPPLIRTGNASLHLNKLGSYFAGNQWLFPVSAEIKNHDKVHLSGDSGSGKSTLLRIIAGLSGHYQGSLVWAGNEKPSVLYIPQTPYIFNRSIRYNLTLGATKSDDQLWAALETVKLKKKISTLPEQLATQLSASGGDFSGGERQRLALARALLVDPDVLLFDESTSNVDYPTALSIEQELLANKDQTVIYVSHEKKAALKEYFDQEIFLKNNNSPE
ncbi:ATP-binding cassette domain-containing protein [Lapidilactobacillus luobeiensis]|uniref:ATP-binding cassette domain-containing protein n=1 Tax=Lapidilactobacillus luobeiensis TaxID=2950371 RepID=UPI0021C2D4D7|nr:ABC transporter ATP-binding protein [Lapidilactobacillus luobeiensis]